MIIMKIFYFNLKNINILILYANILIFHRRNFIHIRKSKLIAYVQSRVFTNGSCLPPR
jgi:hypothetical protein